MIVKQTQTRRALTRWLLIVGLILIGLIAALALASDPALAQEVEPGQGQLAEMSEYLQTELTATDGPISFLVLLKDQPNPNTLATSQSLVHASRTARAAALYAYLTDHAIHSQIALRAWLDEQNASYRPFYIVNMIEVWGDMALAEQLQVHPDVARLIANPQVAQSSMPHLDNSLDHTGTNRDGVQTLVPAEPEATLALPYGLSMTGAPEVWARGYRGEGVVIASEDTGVQWDHPALQPQYRGWNNGSANHIYNWYDAWAGVSDVDPCRDSVQIPCDDHGHGTHTVGTMVGDATAEGQTILGMAPGAKWIGCRNMLQNVGTPASYSACFEFFLAPYPQGGNPFTDGRPEFAPHIINNSWGCPPSEGCDSSSLRQVVETIRMAGQFVVSSAGNYGSACSTVRDPIAIYDAAFSIGAHNSSGTVAGFSSRGPVTIDGSGRLKPDLSAPGVNVYSTYVNPIYRVSTYASLSGTSMAAPHVAGAAALLWSAAPGLIGQIDLTEQILARSANPVPAAQCTGDATPIVPNPVYGYGRLNVDAALTMALNPGALTVSLLDSNDAPIINAQVTLEDELTGYSYMGTTGFDGLMRHSPVYSSTYTLRVTTVEPAATTETLEIAGIPFVPEAGTVSGEKEEGALKIAYRIEPLPSLEADFKKLYFPLMFGD